MHSQLVLQFHGESLGIFSGLENLEERIEESLSSAEKFDGLDVGGHGANLFVYTDDPVGTFEHLRPLLNEADTKPGFTAAFRRVAREQFEVLWPAGSTAAFALR